MRDTPHLPATCSVCGTGPYVARDACPLHAAAPDLLAALEETIQVAFDGPKEPTSNVPAWKHSVEERAHAALDKAKRVK